MQGFAVGLGWVGELGVADGGAVASPVDGVHDGESAAHSEDEAHEESDDCGPVEGHDDVSLLGRRMRYWFQIRGVFGGLAWRFWRGRGVSCLFVMRLGVDSRNGDDGGIRAGWAGGVGEGGL